MYIVEKFIPGLAHALNFSVNGQLIAWKGHNIPAHNISLFSIGISSTYSRAPGGFVIKMVTGAIAAMCVLDEMASENTENLMVTLSGFYNLCIKKERLPCLNLLLNNGMVLEITFMDLWFFRNSVKKVKAVCSHYAGIGNMVVNGANGKLNQIILTGSGNSIVQSPNQEDELTINENRGISVEDFNITTKINQGISKEELDQLRQALVSRPEEDQELKEILQDLIRALEAEKHNKAKTIASGLLENVGASTLANVLGGGTLAIIQKLTGM